jgi:CheY-like chemotaxis protein
MLRPKLTSPEATVLVDEILHASYLAKHLTSQLLLFSRKGKPQREILSPNEIIEETEKLLKRVIGADIDLAVNLEPEVFPVEADPGQLKQILLNLAVNSRDAMPTGGRIRIFTRNVTIEESEIEHMTHGRAGDFVRISVEDNGQGIDPSLQKRIFEPFFTTKDKGKGTGLGLATVYGIVNAHEGWIDLYSEPGRGTVFHIYLPVSKAVANEMNENREASLTDLDGGGKAVLLVEDNKTVRHFTSAVLREHGYEVTEAASADEARKSFKQHDIVLSDVVLSDSTGIQLAHEFLAEHPGLVVCLMSGYTAEDERNDLIHMMEIPFLPKPFTQRELLLFLKNAAPIHLEVGEECELISSCGFHEYLKQFGLPLRRGWIRMFCSSLVKSERCARKRYYLQTGKFPEPSMTPTGKVYAAMDSEA